MTLASCTCPQPQPSATTAAGLPLCYQCGKVVELGKVLEAESRKDDTMPQEAQLLIREVDKLQREMTTMAQRLSALKIRLASQVR